jgi:hypothetical protein
MTAKAPVAANAAAAVKYRAMFGCDSIANPVDVVIAGS